MTKGRGKLYLSYSLDAFIIWVLYRNDEQRKLYWSCKFHDSGATRRK